MLAVFDVDGVLADNSWRTHYIEPGRGKPDWDAFFADVGKDAPLPAGTAAVAAATANGWTPVYLSGRPERCRAATETWLSQHGFPPGRLLLRSDSDRRPATIFKRGALQRLMHVEEIALVVDDDAAVVQMAQNLGLEAKLADWLDN